MTASYCWDDEECKAGTIEEVGPERNGWYSVKGSSGWSCGVESKYGVEPKVGDHFVTWGSIGFPIRGIAINGRVLYYRTPDEQRVEDAKQADAARAERIAEYEGKRGSYDAKVAALPAIFRERIEGFRAFGGDNWRWSFEPYELNCCEEAARIAATFPTANAIRALGKMDYKEQKAAYPEMGSGHSGNSWGKSVRLALLSVERPDLLPMDHGALCPLVGCKDYGCFAVREARS